MNRESAPEGRHPDTTAATAITPQGSAAARGSRSERARALEGLFAIFAENTERTAAQLDDEWGPVEPDELRDILVIDGYRYFSGRLWQAINAGLRRYLTRREA